MEQFNVEWRDIGIVKPYPKNAKKHDSKQIANVAESIKQFGWQQPIVCDADGVIIIGHCRLLAAKKLGLKKVPVKTVDNLSEEQVKKLRAIDNKLNESDWDFDLLGDEIGDLDFSGFDIDWGLPADEEETEIVEDEPPEVDEESEPICKLGDIWQLGRHKLICGDSTDRATVDKLVDNNKIDTYLIDPPYDKEELYDVIPEHKNGKKLMVSYDHKHFVKPIVTAIKMGWKGQYEFIWNCEQCWYTPNRPLARHKTFAVFMDTPEWNFDKAIIYDGKDRKAQKGYNSRGYYDYKPLDGAVHMRTVEDFSNTSMHEECNQGKPVKWIAAMLAGINSEIVLDLFGGSGSTLIACEQLGRVCYMCEISTHYCDVIIKRWENLTGEKAVKIS